MDGEAAESRQTVLYERHVSAGGRMLDFAGWRMPVQYADGIVAEHLWTRKHASVFDVSHMGRFVFRGRGALMFLQRVLTNDASALALGQSHYTIIANESGGAVDDAFLYRFWEGAYILVVNAANKEKDAAHFRGLLAGADDVEMIDVSGTLSMLAVQGPESEGVLRSLIEVVGLPAEGRNALGSAMIAGAEVWLGRTGYTGEPVCFELMFPSEGAGRIWDALTGAGVRPAGLGARDTLRLEAGLPLYGHEYGVDEAGREIPVLACPAARLGVSFAEAKGDYIGRAALAGQREAIEKIERGDETGLEIMPRRVRQIAVTGRGVARQGAAVVRGGSSAGVITSGTMAPYWKTADTCEGVELTDESGMRAVAMGLVDSRIGIGDEVEIDIRGRAVGAKVVRRNLNSAGGKYAIGLVYLGE